MTWSVWGSGGLDAVDHVLQVRAERGDRRLQLVGHVADEIATQSLHVLELAAHPVERDRELPDLVPATRLDPLAVFAPLHPLRRLRHVSERLGHTSREPARDEQRDGRRGHAGREQLPPEPEEEAGREKRPRNPGSSRTA